MNKKKGGGGWLKAEECCWKGEGGQRLKWGATWRGLGGSDQGLDQGAVSPEALP